MNALRILFFVLCLTSSSTMFRAAGQNVRTPTENTASHDSLLKIYGPNEDFERLNAQVEEIVARSNAQKEEEQRQRSIIFWVSLIAAFLPWVALIRSIWRKPSLLQTPKQLLPSVTVMSLLTLVLFLINYFYLRMRAEYGQRFIIFVLAIAVFGMLAYCIVEIRRINRKKSDNFPRDDEKFSENP